MSTLSTDADSGEDTVLDTNELKKLAGVNEEELAETLFQRLQGRLPTKLFDKMTEDLLQEGVVLEDGLASVYDKLTLKMFEMLIERMFKSLKNWSSADKENGDVDPGAQLNRSISFDTQNCGAKTLKRKWTEASTRNVKIKMRPTAPVQVPMPVIHALLIDHVLDTIFGNFVYEDKGAVNLANFRLVCRLWNQRATEALRRTEINIIFEGNDFELEDSESKLQRYIQTMENSSLIPFRYYSLKLGILPQDSLNINLMEKFLQTIGPDAVALKFHFGMHFSLPFEICRTNFNLTNMERLEIYFREPYFGFSTHLMYMESGVISNETGIPQFIIKLLTGAPKLKVFAVREKVNSRKCAPEIFKWVPETVKEIRLNLQKFASPYFRALAEPKLKLVQLSLGCLKFESVGGDNDANDFFRMQNKSLTTLNLNELSMSIFSENFPQLESLRSLTLEINRFRPLDMPISDVFPNLRVLKLEHKSCSLVNLILLSNSSGEIVTSVEELHLLSPIYYHQHQAMELLSKRFPNVKSLFVRLSSSSLSSVCTHYTEIEELHLSLPKGGGCFNVDADLCGVSNAICKGLLDKNTFRKIDLEDFQKGSTLLDLTKLKKLALNSFPNQYAPLTDISAHHILLKMENLKELIIPKSNLIKMSPWYLEQLKAKLKIVYCRPQRNTSQNKSDDQFGYEFTMSQPVYYLSPNVEMVESSETESSDSDW